jgi:hypothetical protein
MDRGKPMGLLSPKCESCGQKVPEVVEHRTGRKLCPACAAKADEYLAKLARIIVSTGDLARPYEVVQVVIQVEGGIDGWDAIFARALRSLKADALKLGCDAVISVAVEHRTILHGETPGVEFLLYGTAVRFT